MNNQEKKQILSRYWTNEREIERLEEELKRCESRALKVTASLTGLPGSHVTGNLVLDSVEKIVMLQQAINVQIDRGIQFREEIERSIQTVEEARLQLLLRYRYIDGKTLEQIAILMCCSWRQVCRIHGQALTTIQIIL